MASSCPSCKQKGSHNKQCCHLCQSAVFCSDQCQTVSWASHNCENVIDVPDKNTTLFVPYFGEENMTEEMISDLPKNAEPYQNHLLRFVDPKGYIEQCVVESLIGLDVSPSEFELPQEDFKYEIGIEIGDQQWTIPNLTTKTTLISEQNKNSIYSRLAKSRPIGFPSFWPGKNVVASQNIVVSTKEPTFVNVTAGNLSLQGILELSPLSADMDSWLKRRNRVLTPVQMDYKTKCGEDRTYLLQNLRAYRAMDDVGNAAVFIFDGTKNQLIDVELMSPSAFQEDAEYDYEQMRFNIDPNNVAHVNGLVMALEDKMANGSLPITPSLQKQFGLINQYREDLESGKMTEPNAQINAAIRGTTEQLWELVEARRSAATFLSKKRSDISRARMAAAVANKYRKMINDNIKRVQKGETQIWPTDELMLDDFIKYVNATTSEQNVDKGGSYNLRAALAIDAAMSAKPSALLSDQRYKDAIKNLQIATGKETGIKSTKFKERTKKGESKTKNTQPFSNYDPNKPLSEQEKQLQKTLSELGIDE